MKSHFVSFLLTVCIGPVGVFYSSAPAGMMLTLIAVIGGLMTGGIITVVVWPIAIIVGDACVSNHNKKAKEEQDRTTGLVKGTNNWLHQTCGGP